jgi:chromosome segregation and condensation protein ScpB
MLARLAREGIAGSDLEAIALSGEFPAATAAVAADVLRKVRRFTEVSLSKPAMFYLAIIVHQ